MISTLLADARAVARFCEGKTVAGVYEPLDNHTRFRFTDESALLVVFYQGPRWATVQYYAEPALDAARN